MENFTDKIREVYVNTINRQIKFEKEKLDYNQKHGVTDTKVKYRIEGKIEGYKNLLTIIKGWNYKNKLKS